MIMPVHPNKDNDLTAPGTVLKFDSASNLLQLLVWQTRLLVSPLSTPIGVNRKDVHKSAKRCYILSQYTANDN